MISKCCLLLILMTSPATFAAEKHCYMCDLHERTRLTEERTIQLRRWVKGIPEGDVCAGSIKFEDAAKTSKEPK